MTLFAGGLGEVVDQLLANQPWWVVVLVLVGLAVAAFVGFIAWEVWKERKPSP